MEQDRWNQTDAQRRNQMHLEQIYDEGAPGSWVGVRRLFEGLEHDARQTVFTDLQHLDRIDLIDLRATAGLTGSHVRMTPAGQQYVEELRRERGNAAERRRHVRDAVLDWLYREHLIGSAPDDMGEFWTTPHSLYLGEHFTVAEFDHAVEWLLGKELIKGIPTGEGVLVRPSPTHKGEDVIESGRSVNDPPPHQAAGANVYVTGHGNVIQAGSPGATQHATITLTVTDDHRKQTLHLADVIEQAAPVLGADAPELPALLRDAVAEGQDDPGRVKQALSKVSEVLTSAATSALSSAILQVAGPLLAQYGIHVGQ